MGLMVVLIFGNLDQSEDFIWGTSGSEKVISIIAVQAKYIHSEGGGSLSLQQISTVVFPKF